MKVFIGLLPQSSVTNPDPTYLTQDPNASPSWVNVPPLEDLIVFADTIYIAGPLLLLGSNVSLVARQFGWINDTGGRMPAITVDGAPSSAPPVPTTLPQAANGADGTCVESTDVPSDGEDGTGGGPGNEGAVGSSGGKGGTISIVAGSLASESAIALSANGSAGGAGQDGGPGQQGGNGGDGTTCPGMGGSLCSSGGNGANGGMGGTAGAGGSGGPGGTINVMCLSAQPAGVTFSVNGGPAGRSGSPGAGGLAGNGGAAGQGNIPGPDSSCPGGDGSPGSPGKLGAPATAASPGPPGNATWTVVQASQFPLTYDVS